MSAGKSHFTLIPDWWIRDILPVRHGLFRIACELAFHANKQGITYVSATSAAENLHLSREHVTRAYDELCRLGVISPTGRTVKRAKEYQIMVRRPVTATVTGSSDDDRHTAENRLVISEATSCDDGGGRPVTTAIHKNGIGTVLKNGSIDRRPFESPTRANERDDGLADDLRQQLASALKPFKAPGEIDDEIGALIRQVGSGNIPRLIGWLNSDLSRASNPLGLALSQIRAGKDAPRETKAGLRSISTGHCTDCDSPGSGQMLGGEFWCIDCIESARATFCGMNCSVRHYPWEPCGTTKERPRGRGKSRGYYKGERYETYLVDAPNGWSDMPPRGKTMAELWPEHKNYGIDYESPDPFIKQGAA